MLHLAAAGGGKFRVLRRGWLFTASATMAKNLQFCFATVLRLVQITEHGQRGHNNSRSRVEPVFMNCCSVMPKKTNNPMHI